MDTLQAPAAPDYAAIKNKQLAAWSTGDYGRIGVTLQIVGESLAEAANLKAGERVLDVAAGNGNVTLAAARRFTNVTSTDYVSSLLEQGRRRAEAEGHAVEFRVADVEDLPFENDSFDAVLSTYGVMFAPNQEKAASEMMRVVKPGGRIGLANWTPEGFIGELFRVVGRFAPPPAGLKPAAAWGTETRLVELFGPKASAIRTERKSFVFRYHSAEHWIAVFRTWYGPVNRAFASLDAEGEKAFHAALAELLNRLNQGGPNSLVIPGEYLEVVIEKA